MDYLVLLYGTERELFPADQQAEMAAYEKFHATAGPALQAGDALLPAATTVTINRRGAEPVVTAGPYTEATEVLGGYYVLAGESLDDIVELARHIPAVQRGAGEIRPLVQFSNDPSGKPAGATSYLALLHGVEGPGSIPGSAEWDASVAEHEAFGQKHGANILGGAALRESATATTVRARDGEVLLSDGPFTEGAEVVGGYYVLWANTPEEAATMAADIPEPIVEVRPIMDFG